MGWFDNQIKDRITKDNDVYATAYEDLYDSIMGTKVSRSFESDSEKAKSAIKDILRYYHIKPREIPGSVKKLDDQLEFLMHPHGIMRRRVKLSPGWHADAVGPMIGIRKSDGTTVAFIPKGSFGYTFFDAVGGKYEKVTSKNEDLFEDVAIAFYRAFPAKKITVPELFKYIFSTFSSQDHFLVGGVTLAVTLIGMLTPKLNNILVGPVLESGVPRALIAIMVFMASVSVSSLLITSAKTVVLNRISTKMDMTVQAAAMSRILSLPLSFFKSYSSGQINSRVNQIYSLCTMLFSTVYSSGLTSILSLVYVTQIITYAPALVYPALGLIAANIIFTVASVIVNIRMNQSMMENSAEEEGLTYAFIKGIQKIKLAGAEKRAFARWAKVYDKNAKLVYDPPDFVTYNATLGMIIAGVGAVVMYYCAAANGITVADYVAFNSAYGMVSGAFMSLTVIARNIASIKPMFEMVRPIMETVPEVSEGKQVIMKLSGGIELSNVSFRYSPTMPNVIDNLSLKIRPGQYVAIVGATGCGKSTLLRLLLGFETPQKGAIYYDGKDLNTIDLKSLRRRIGVALQSGKLFSGSILSNITISAPSLTLDEAWQAAEMAGIAEDIRAMPMGMNTLISESGAGISGGQRQRLLIAQALAIKPKILMLDEATSALDNITQAQVAQTLSRLKCTRIVVAHRLSTIKQCSRILFLEDGHIAEDGTYEELIAKNGKFAELVRRQQIDV